MIIESSQSSILVPSAAPQDVRLEDVVDGVLLKWTYSNHESPECMPYFLITGYQNGVAFTQKVDGRVREYRFENPVGGEWQAELRAGNTAGTGPASSIVKLQTQQQGSLLHHCIFCAQNPLGKININMVT